MIHPPHRPRAPWWPRLLGALALAALAVAPAAAPARAQQTAAGATVGLSPVARAFADRIVMFSAPSDTGGSPVAEITRRDRVQLLFCIGGLSAADAARLSPGERAAYRPEEWCKVRRRRQEGWVAARHLDLGRTPEVIRQILP